MDRNITMILLFLGFCIPSFHLKRQFHYVNLKMNWTDAQRYCRARYTDLAAFQSMEQISRLNRPALDTSEAWIGLSDRLESWNGTLGDEASPWRWSATGKTSKTGFNFWSTGQPDNYGPEYCGMMYDNGRWNDMLCGYTMSFICYNETAKNVKTYVFIEEKLNWTDAHDYCRRYYKDLSMIENSVENRHVKGTIPASVGGVWIGLYRVPWTWSDHSSSLIRNWGPGQPDNKDRLQICVTEDAQHYWHNVNCNAENTFICQQDPKLQWTTVVRMKIQTSADMTDPAIITQFHQQLGAVLNRGRPMDVKLRWKIQPRKQKKNQKEPEEAQCNVNLHV